MFILICNIQARPTSLWQIMLTVCVQTDVHGVVWWLNYYYIPKSNFSKVWWWLVVMGGGGGVGEMLLMWLLCNSGNCEFVLLYSPPPLPTSSWAISSAANSWAWVAVKPLLKMRIWRNKLHNYLENDCSKLSINKATTHVWESVMHFELPYSVDWEGCGGEPWDPGMST